MGKAFKSSASEELGLLFFIPFFAGAVSVPQKQWRGLDGRGRSGDKRGTAAPSEGEEAPPRHCSMGKGSDQGGSSCLEPPFHFVGGVMDGWKNELVSEGRLVCLQTSAFPLWGPWPYFENWYRSLWLPTFWAGAGGSGNGNVLRGWRDWGTARRVFWVCSKVLRCLGTKCCLLLPILFLAFDLF